jgi:hypothetical protein
MKFSLRQSRDFPVDNVLEMAKEIFNFLKYDHVILFILNAKSRRDAKYLARVIYRLVIMFCQKSCFC